MKSLAKKMLIFALVMAVVAASGWFGRKAYKRAVERRSIAEARHYLEQNDVRNAVLCVQRALRVNPLSLPPCQITFVLAVPLAAPATLGSLV